LNADECEIAAPVFRRIVEVLTKTEQIKTPQALLA
jgi:hypothetical protein